MPRREQNFYTLQLPGTPEKLSRSQRKAQKEAQWQKWVEQYRLADIIALGEQRAAAAAKDPVAEEEVDAARALSLWPTLEINSMRDLRSEIVNGAIVPAIVRWVQENYLADIRDGRQKELVWKLLRPDFESLGLSDPIEEAAWITESLANGGRGMNKLRKLIRAVIYDTDPKSATTKAEYLVLCQLPASLSIYQLIERIQSYEAAYSLQSYIHTTAAQGKLREITGMLSEQSKNILNLPILEKTSPLTEAIRFLGEVFHKIANETLGEVIAEYMAGQPDLYHPDNLAAFGQDRRSARNLPSNEHLERLFHSSVTSELDEWFPTYAGLVDTEAAMLFLNERIDKNTYQWRIFLLLFKRFIDKYQYEVALRPEDIEDLAKQAELSVHDFQAMHDSALELVAKNFVGRVMGPISRLSRVLYRVWGMLHHGEIAISSRYNPDNVREEKVLHIAAEKLIRARALSSRLSIYDDLKQAQQEGILKGLSVDMMVAPDLLIQHADGKLLILDYKTSMHLHREELEATAVSYALLSWFNLSSPSQGGWGSPPRPAKDFRVSPLPGYADLFDRKLQEKVLGTEVIFVGIGAGKDIVVKITAELIERYARALEINWAEGKALAARTIDPES